MKSFSSPSRKTTARTQTTSRRTSSSRTRPSRRARQPLLRRQRSLKLPPRRSRARSGGDRRGEDRRRLTNRVGRRARAAPGPAHVSLDTIPVVPMQFHDLSWRPQWHWAVARLNGCGEGVSLPRDAQTRLRPARARISSLSPTIHLLPPITTAFRSPTCSRSGHQLARAMPKVVTAKLTTLSACVTSCVCSHSARLFVIQAMTTPAPPVTHIQTVYTIQPHEIACWLAVVRTYLDAVATLGGIFNGYVWLLGLHGSVLELSISAVQK